MFALLLAASVVTSAAPAPAAAKPTPEAAAKAKEAFAAGKKLYDQAKYSEAVIKFEEAYAARPHPIIYFNIGKCYELMGETGKGESSKALRAYREYLRGTPDASDKAAVNESIATLERRLKDRGVQQVTIVAEPANARIEIDGKDVGPSPASAELAAGPHKLVAKAEGFEAQERPFTMSLAHSQELTVALKPGTPGIPSDAPKNDDLKQPSNAAIAEPPPATPAADPAASSPAVAKKAPPAKKGGRLFTWVAAGVAVAGAGAGAGLGVVSGGATSELKGSVHNRAEADALVSKANSMALGANVSYGVAGAAAVTAVVLFFLEGR